MREGGFSKFLFAFLAFLKFFAFCIVYIYLILLLFFIFCFPGFSYIVLCFGFVWVLVFCRFFKHLIFAIFLFTFLKCFWPERSAYQQQQQAGSELNAYLDDVIHKRGPNMSVYTNIYML